MTTPTCRACQGSGLRQSEFPIGPCPTCHGTGTHRWVSAFIQARSGSHRYPGKIYVQLAGVPVLRRVYEATRLIPGVDTVVVIAPDGDRLTGLGVPVWAEWPGVGEDDVLARYQQAAQLDESDLILRVTGDSPCLDPALCTRVLTRLQAEPTVSYVHTDAPSGLGCEGFTRLALEEAGRDAMCRFDREHVTSWMRLTLPPHAQAAVGLDQPWRGPAKMSLDTPEEWHRLEAFLRPRTEAAAVHQTAGATPQ